ncbi:MAG: hypothetical protein AAB573_02515 [Patescibacteria group bacterium]
MEQQAATALEQDYELMARARRWFASKKESTKWALAAVGGVAAGAIAAGAVIGIGAGTLVVGATGALIVRSGLPYLAKHASKILPWYLDPTRPFLNFHADSKQLIDSRELFENAWVRAESEGVSYDEFRRKNYYAKQYRKERRWDKGTRIAATATGSFGAFGATHIRTGVLDTLASEINARTHTTGLGEAVVYGERLVQRTVRFAGHLAATLVGGAFDGLLEMVGVKPACGAEMPNPEMGRPQGVPILEDGLTEANRQRTIKMVRLHIEWMKQVRAKFAVVFGTGYTGYYSTLQRIDYAIERLTATLKHIQSASLSKVPN